MTTQQRSEPIPSRHRAQRGAAPGTWRLARVGVLATAAVGVLAATAGAAQAAAFSNGFSTDTGGIAIADNDAFALSTAHDPMSFEDSFTVHQYGQVEAASVRNESTAESVACAPDSPCRAVSLSFQIITMAGTDIHLNAVNLSNATNVHCAGCQTLAGAYQFVVDTPSAFKLSPAAEAQLAAIHRELNALSNSDLSTSDVQSRADALAVQVAAILKTAATPAQTPIAHAQNSAAPRLAPAVTVYRDFQQH